MGPVRAGIAGTGFVGGVHARSVRLAGGRLAGVSTSSPERAQAAAEALGAERAFDSAEEMVRDPDIDVVHICTPNHLHLPLAEAALEAGKHVICEKPLALDAAGARRLLDAAAGTGLQAAVPFVYRYYPTVREARERVRGGDTGALQPDPRQLPPGLAPAARGRQLAGGRAAGRPLASLRGHRVALVRPGRVHLRPSHRAGLGADATTVLPERLGAEGRHAFASGGEPGEARPVTTEDAAVVQFETDGGAMGSVVVSQVSAGRKNRLWIELDGADEALAFDHEEPEDLWCGRREAVTILRRDPATLSPPAARYAFLPGGHPQGYADCFDAFVARCVRRHPRRHARGGNAVVRRRPARGAHHRGGAHLLAGAELGGRGRRPGARGLPGGGRMKLGFLTSCMPERSLEDIAAWAGANGYEALELASWPHLGDRPFTASHVRADAFDQAEQERVASRPGRARPDPVGARLLRQQPRSRPGRARGLPRAPARLHRRGGRPGRRARGDLHRPRSRAQRRGEPARGRARSSRRSWTTPASAACA